MTPRQPDPVRDHEQWEELAVGHALHALEPADHEAFTRHLASCDACQKLVAEMHDVAADLAYAAEPADPPASTWSAIAAAVAASERPPLPPAAVDPTHPRRRGSSEAGTSGADDIRIVAAPARGDGEGSAAEHSAAAARRPWWLRSTALGLAAVLVGIVGLGGVVLLGRFLQVRNDKAAADRQLSAVLNCAGRTDCAVLPLKARAGSSAAAVALVQAGRVQLVVNKLAATDPNSTYVLWAGRSATALTGVGTFLIANPGRHIVSPELTSAVGGSGTLVLAVTREPGRAIPASPSTAPTLSNTA